MLVTKMTFWPNLQIIMLGTFASYNGLNLIDIISNQEIKGHKDCLNYLTEEDKRC
jgi:hypothetical protein